MQVGRKIYYELATGHVIIDTGERQGDVIETTQDQDFTMYSALQPYQMSAVGVLQLTFGQDAENFGKYPYHIDITKKAIVWDTANPIGASLQDVQSAKIAQIRDMYNQTLASGFNVTIGTTQYTFGWTGDDITHMTATQTAAGKGFITFPFDYVDITGSPVNIPDQATLDNIENTATKFMMAQHQQAIKLVTQVQAINQANYSTTQDAINAVNAIQWSPASY